MFNKKRIIVLAGVVAAALGLAAGAFAYFSSSGSGSGSGSVGTASAISISSTGPADALYPGGAGVDVPITVANNGSGAEYVHAVQLSGISTTASGCDTSITGSPAAFAMPDVTVNQTIAAGDQVTVHGTLSMNDTGVSQDACEGASLTLNFTSN